MRVDAHEQLFLILQYYEENGVVTAGFSSFDVQPVISNDSIMDDSNKNEIILFIVTSNEILLNQFSNIFWIS